MACIMRECKGNCLMEFPDDFVVLDLETTGLDPTSNEIIEIGIVRVENNSIVDSFDELVCPDTEIDPFITSLTGITNEMVCDKPAIADVLPRAMHFIDDNIIVGHNVNFDINFVYDSLVRNALAPIDNDYIDTLKLSRHIVKGLPHYRLGDMVEYFHIHHRRAHRALSDVEMTFDLYECLKHLHDTCPCK